MIKYLLATLLFVSVCFSAEPGAITANNPDSRWAQDIISSAAYDTLETDDTITILSSYDFDMDYDYIIVKDLLGGSADSCSLAVEVSVYDKGDNSSIAYIFAIDSIFALAGEIIEIPAEKLFGEKFDIDLISIGGNRVYLNKMWLYKRRIVSLEKKAR